MLLVGRRINKQKINKKVNKHVIIFITYWGKGSFVQTIRLLTDILQLGGCPYYKANVIKLMMKIAKKETSKNTNHGVKNDVKIFKNNISSHQEKI